MGIRARKSAPKSYKSRVRLVNARISLSLWIRRCRFLGFTHYCGKLRKNGAFTVWRVTAKKRMVAKLLAIKAELILRRHEPKAVIGEWLRKVVLGYYRYHAVPGNMPQLESSGIGFADCGGWY